MLAKHEDNVITRADSLWLLSLGVNGLGSSFMDLGSSFEGMHTSPVGNSFRSLSCHWRSDI